MKLRHAAVLLGTLIAAHAVAQDGGHAPAHFHFIAANFVTSSPAAVAWLDERTIVFSVGSVGTTLGTECWPKVLRPDCNDRQSIQLWQLDDNRISLYMDKATLRCLSRGRITVYKDGRWFSALAGGVPKDTGLEAGLTYAWNDCLPTVAPRTVDERGIVTVHGKEHQQFYEFKQAYLRADRYNVEKATLIWTSPSGSETKEELIDGPWNMSGRLWESYYPTKAGVIIADDPRNYFAEKTGYREFFPGHVSFVGISPSGCRAAFFGDTYFSNPRRTEVHLYWVELCGR